MSARGETVLLTLLSDYESLEELASTGLPIEAVPTVKLRPIVTWALDHYFASGRRRGPSREAILTTWGQLLQDNEVEFLPEDECDTMAWAIEDLKADYARSMAQAFSREFATATAPKRKDEDTGSHAIELASVIHDYAGQLVDLDLSLADDHQVQPVGSGLEGRIAAYERRVEEGEYARGLLLGYDEIDHHIGGIHEGEIAVIGAGAKHGKSFVLDDIAKNNWERDYPAVLFTLENSLEMTLDRIACLGAHVDPERFERGTLTDEELERVREFRKTKGDNFFVVEPSEDERTPQALYRQAQLLGASAMIVDQLSWVKHPNPSTRRPRNQEVAEIMRMFATAINTPHARMSLLLAHQIKREGIEAAAKRGYHVLTDFADGSEVERAVSFAFGLYQGRENAMVNRMLFHMMAARRVSLKHWIMGWRLQYGTIGVYHETELPNSEVSN